MKYVFIIIVWSKSYAKDQQLCNLSIAVTNFPARWWRSKFYWQFYISNVQTDILIYILLYPAMSLPPKGMKIIKLCKFAKIWNPNDSCI